MRISHDGSTVSFKTEPKELFEAEKSGAKPNTVRIVDQDEYIRLVKANPKKIIVQHQQEIFLRTITNIHATEGVFGKVIVVISWKNENHHHAATRETVPHGPGDHTQSLVGPHSVPVEPGPHNASFDYVPEMPPLPSICKCANCIKGNEIKDDFHVHTLSPDELAPVLLPRTLIHDLGRFRQDQSHADFIRKLLVEHLNKLVEEGGPMHD
jgi:hypothetical protein